LPDPARAPGQPSPLGKDLPEGARRLLKYAIAALARREHSRAEIERKLVRRLQPEESEGDVNLVLDCLLARGLLSDRRMAELLVRSRVARYGRLRIEQELERRGVDRETIAAALPPVADEAALALRLWRRKFGQAPTSLQERARQSRFLAARGFSAAVIGRILSTADDGP
jgi:regulatory protein